MDTTPRPCAYAQGHQKKTHLKRCLWYVPVNGVKLVPS